MSIYISQEHASPSQLILLHLSSTHIHIHTCMHMCTQTHTSASQLHTCPQTNLYTNRITCTERDTPTYTQIHTCPGKETQANRQTDAGQTETQKHTLRKTHRKRHGETGEDAHTIHAETHRGIYAQNDAHAEAHAYRDTHTLSNNFHFTSSVWKNPPFLWDFTNMSHGEHPSP